MNKDERLSGAKKIPGKNRGTETFGVDDGARTHDPQNHNLVL